MTRAEWQLDVAPTAREVYEAMVLAGRGVFRGRQRIAVILHGAARLATVPTEAFSSSSPSSVKQSLFIGWLPGESIQ